MQVSLVPLSDALLDPVTAMDHRSSVDPWNRGQWEEETNKPHAHSWVAVDAQGAPVGAVVGWRVADEMQVVNLLVDPPWRRQGVAHLLLARLWDHCREWGLRKVTLEVREGNLGAWTLYRSLGFVETGRRPEFYDDNETAILMEVQVDEVPSRAT
jgi:ribosomal-protein-alanine N-acetyltransferase